MEEEELEEERRVVREAEVEETGARRAPGRVTAKNLIREREKIYCYSSCNPCCTIIQHSFRH